MFTILGIFAGTITGLIPGLHINLVSVILLTLSPFLLGYTGVLSLVALIIAMSITHTFTDFIAATYLGAPDADTALAVLPAHQLLLEGKGFEAIRLTVAGSLLCLLFVISIIPFLIIAVPLIFTTLQPFIGFLLLAISVFMLLREPSWRKKGWATFVFLSAGILGIVTFTLPNLEEPLFPLLSGMFGISMLLTSLSQQTKIPKQRITEQVLVSNKDAVKAVSSGVFSGSLVSIFPGLGPAQAAILATQFFKKISTSTYLVVVGGINTVSMVMALITLLTINKARNGSIVVVQELLPEFSLTLLGISISVALIAGGIATIATLWIGKVFSNVMNKVNYKVVSLAIIFFLIILSFYFGGLMGFFVLSVSTSIGIIPVLKGVGRNHAMGVLLLPVILYFLL